MKQQNGAYRLEFLEPRICLTVLSLSPDPHGLTTLRPIPASPTEGAIITVNAFCTDPNILTDGTQFTVDWGDGQTITLPGNPAEFTAYPTGDASTIGIRFSHIFSSGGSYNFSVRDSLGFTLLYSSVVLPGSPPVLKTPIHVTSVSGPDYTLAIDLTDPGHAPLSYGWSYLVEPNNVADPYFSDATATPTVTFYGAGDYQLFVLARNPGGIATQVNFKIHIKQRVSSLFVWPENVTVAPGRTYPLHAIALDQFGNAMHDQPHIRWSLSGNSSGRITHDGRYTASQTPANDTAIVTAMGPSGIPITAAVPVHVDSSALPAAHPPGHMINVHVQRDDNQNAMLTWTPTGAAADGVVISASFDEGIIYAVLGNALPGQNSFLAQNLVGNARYIFQMFPFNAAGRGRSIITKPVYVQVSGAPSTDISGGITGHPGEDDIVTVVNTTSAPFSPGGYDVNVYATSDGYLNGAILLGSAFAPTFLAPGASSTFTVHSMLPPSIPPGVYRLMAAVKDAAGFRTAITSEIESFKIPDPPHPL